MNEDLQEICKSLDELSEAVLKATSEDRLFSEYQNWQWPALNRHILATIPRNLSNLIRENYYENIDDSVTGNLEYIETSIEYLKNTLVSNMFNQGFLIK